MNLTGSKHKLSQARTMMPITGRQKVLMPRRPMVRTVGRAITCIRHKDRTLCSRTHHVPKAMHHYKNFSGEALQRNRYSHETNRHKLQLEQKVQWRGP